MASDSKKPARSESHVALASFGAVTALIGIFLLRDASAFVRSPLDELIGHLGASGGFTVAATGTYLVLRRERPPLLTILLMGAAITIAGELAQGFAPKRGIQLKDFFTGFGGVLVAGVGIEFVLRRFSRLTAQRLHALAAAVASIALTTILGFDLAPDTVAGAAPDGDSCPLTTLDGSAQRIVIGEDPAIVDGCLQTAAGGLGLFGPDGSDSLDDESVLLSSPLDALADEIVESGGVSVSTGFVTDDFRDDVRPAGVIMILRSNEAGELLQIRTRDQTVQVIGPNFPELHRGLAYPQVLEPNTRYQLRVELTATELRIFVDDARVATTTVNPAWLDAFTNPETTDRVDDLTFYIGNSVARTLPFHGVIEWVEIDT